MLSRVVPHQRMNDKSPIRVAREDDLPAIVEIYNATIPSRMATGDLEPVPVESRRAWFAQHDPSRHPIWVIEQSGRVAAWLSLSPFHSRPAYDGAFEVGLYVREDNRRRGLGAMLLVRAIGDAPALGAHSLLGLIWGHNAPSLALFERFGFVRWGHLPSVARLDGVPRDLVIVGRNF